MKREWLVGRMWSRGFWFRVFGYGLHVKFAKGHSPLFSERNGFRRAYYALGLRFEVLTPVKNLLRSEESR